MYVQYLQCLLQSLRTLLGDMEHGDPRVPWRPGTTGCRPEKIAVVEAEEEGVAAIHGQGSSGRRQNQKKEKTGQQKKCQQDQLWPGVL